MENPKSGRIIPLLVLLIAAALCVQPAIATTVAVTDTMYIAYRGNGGYYIGDTIVLDGYNKAGNNTALKITGPGLPDGGVPVYDLSGNEGTGNPVVMNDDGSWRFVWYTGSIKSIDKMQTARYRITAFDLQDPSQAATISVMMKKPDFFAVASPDTLETGEYVQLIGTAEQGTSDIRISVSDEVGKVYHVYDTAASRSGYFAYAFHVDMPPGVYYVTISSPSVANTYRTTLTIVPPPTPSTNVTGKNPDGTPVMTRGTGTLSLSSSPSGASVFIDSVSMGTTPVTLADLAPGNHLVEIKSPGYLTFSIQVTISAGETTTISPTLVKNPLPTPLSAVIPLIGLVVAGAVFLIVSAGRKNQ